MMYEFDEGDEPDFLLERIVKSLVGVPDEAIINTTESPSTTILTIDVLPDDRGKIIGRGGSIINSLKTVFHALGCKQGKRIVLEIRED